MESDNCVTTVWMSRLLNELKRAGSWRDVAVKFVNSVTTLMERLLHYRYWVGFYAEIFIFHILWSTNQLLLACPRFSTEFGKRSFGYLAPTVWNDLPLDTRLSPTTIPLSAVSRQSSSHSLPVLPPSDCRCLRFSVTTDFCAPYKLLYYYYYSSFSVNSSSCIYD